jgi:hypothetical protein
VSENCEYTWRYFGVAEETDTASDKFIAANIIRGVASTLTSLRVSPAGLHRSLDASGETQPVTEFLKAAG